MSKSSRSSDPPSRSTEEKEAWALKAIFRAMYAVGVSATNVDEAEQAIDLAAKLLSYALGREVGVDEIKDRMVELIEEEWAEALALDKDMTKH